MLCKSARNDTPAFKKKNSAKTNPSAKLFLPVNQGSRVRSIHKKC